MTLADVVFPNHILWRAAFEDAKVRTPEVKPHLGNREATNHQCDLSRRSF